MSHGKAFWLCFALGAALTGLPTLGTAQSLGVSGGLAVPAGSLGEHRSVGLRAQFSAFSPGGLLRADLAGVLFPGEDHPTAPPWRTGGWRSLNLAGNILPLLSRSDSVEFRGVIGLSAHRMSISGRANPYGIVPGFQLGSMFTRPWNGRTLTAEFGFHLVASDFGVAEYSGSYSFPLLVGIRW